MVAVLERPSAEFEFVVAPAPPQHDVTLSIDADLMDRLRERDLNAARKSTACCASTGHRRSEGPRVRAGRMGARRNAGAGPDTLNTPYDHPRVCRVVVAAL